MHGRGDEAVAPVHSMAMQRRRAYVKEGRFVLDEPADQPGGLEVKQVPAEEDLDPTARSASLLAVLDEGIDDFERGDHIDGFELVAQMRARREAAGC